MSQHPYVQIPLARCTHGWLRAGYIAAACLLGASCVLAPQQFTEKQALDVNQEVGRGENDLMVVNIVRAELREPLVYTNYDKFTEALPTTSASLSLTSLPSITQTAGTSQFDDMPMDRNQQYLAEVTTPVTSATFKYYYDQGWPTSLLLHLFVGEIHVIKTDGRKIVDITRYSNYPYDLQSYQAFDRLANALGGCRFTPEKADQQGPAGAGDLPGFELSPPTVKDANGSNVAAMACKEILDSSADLNNLPLCDPNKSEENQGKDCVEFVYRSPALVVTYLGDLLRQQWFGDINKMTFDADSPKILGVTTYSDACFFKLRQTGKQKSEPCQRYCDAIFVMKNESAAATDPKGMKPQCEWPTDLAEMGVLIDQDNTIAQNSGENGNVLSVSFENTRYDLPLNYLDHTETMHTLEIADLLMGYQVGVKTDAEAAKKAAKP